jgi:hypothetical protein
MPFTRTLTALVVAGGLTVVPALPVVAAPADVTPPTLTITGVKWRTFYPVVDLYKDTAEVSYQHSDDSADPTLVVHLEITDEAGALVLERIDTLPTPGAAGYGWNGRDSGGTLQPAGDYTLTFWATDSAENASEPVSRTVTLSRNRLVTKTFRREVSAARTIVDRRVGRCSRLRRPSLRGWSGSLGYYSNETCHHTGSPSVVATVNGVYVPRAFHDRAYGSFYNGLVVKGYGGAARSRNRSKSLLQYWNQQDRRWFGASWFGPRVGTHAGTQVWAQPMVSRNLDGRPYLRWSLLTAEGHRYDLKTFTVVLKYQVLRDPAA